MRRVTAKPPNMLIVASPMPPMASQRIHSFGRERSAEIFVRSGAICTSAPIAMMLQIALVTLISGVCSAGVTFHDHAADEARQHEHGEVAEEARRREAADQQEQQRADAEEAPPSSSATSGRSASPWPFGFGGPRRLWRRRGGAAASFGAGGGQ